MNYCDEYFKQTLGSWHLSLDSHESTGSADNLVVRSSQEAGRQTGREINSFLGHPRSSVDIRKLTLLETPEGEGVNSSL